MKVGIDIIEIERIRKAFEKFKERFINRIFNEEEKEFCMRNKDPFPCFAARFAAKEAFMKAIGTGLSKGVSYQDITVKRKPNSAPILIVNGQSKKLLKNKKVEISISHSKNYALCVCIIY